MKLATAFSCILLLFACQQRSVHQYSLQTEGLRIDSITSTSFVHTSYIDLPDYGPFSCNGLIVIEDGNAIIFDTPVSDSIAKELIRFVRKKLNCKIKAVIVNHFHEDCLGSLNVFHQKGIPSFANRLTQKMATQNQETSPTIGFNDSLVIELEDQFIENRFLGKAHSPDNIISYIPKDKILFGGCMIKSMNASKGNLSDASVEEWPKTVQRIKTLYPDIKYVVPGHGEVGGTELLDYTIELFSKEK